MATRQANWYQNLSPNSKEKKLERDRKASANRSPATKKRFIDNEMARRNEQWGVEDWDRARDAVLASNRKRRKAEKVERASIYPVATNPFLPTIAAVFNNPETEPPIPTIRVAEGKSIIVISRISWRKDGAWMTTAKTRNAVAMDKFINDFVSPSTVLSKDSVVWNGRAAWVPFPYALANDRDNIQFPEGEFENEDADRRFCEFFLDAPDHTDVLILIRGIDGATIDPGSYAFLAQRFPRLNITLIFQCTEDFVTSRAPAPHGPAWFSRTVPFDNKLYGFVPLSTLTGHMAGTTNDALCAWILEEWRLGRLTRQSVSMAFQTGETADISMAAAQHMSLHTRRRNDAPWVEG